MDRPAPDEIKAPTAPLHAFVLNTPADGDDELFATVELFHGTQ
jgi:hypothetical protein